MKQKKIKIVHIHRPPKKKQATAAVAFVVCIHTLFNLLRGCFKCICVLNTKKMTNDSMRVALFLIFFTLYATLGMFIVSERVKLVLHGDSLFDRSIFV